MDLFDHPADCTKNLLPYNGKVNYYGKIFSIAQASKFLTVLRSTLAWQHDEAVIMGKRIVTKRKVAWYGDKPYQYTYSKKTKTALKWVPALLQLKDTIEKLTDANYNSCLANLYHNGDEGMAYHSDDEKDLEENATIASLSFGAERKFLFKHKHDKTTIATFLEHGSLLVMKDDTQKNWLHRLPPTKKTNEARINLTFRKMLD